MAICFAYRSFPAHFDQSISELLFPYQLYSGLVSVLWFWQSLVCFTPGRTGKSAAYKILVYAFTGRNGDPGSYRSFLWEGVLLLGMSGFFFLELFDRLRKFVTGRKFLKNSLLVAKRLLWFVLIAELMLSMILGVPLFVFLSPPGLIGREIMMLVFFQTVALEGVILLLIILLELSTRRFFCRTFCPLGGLLAFLGRNRSLRVQVDRLNCTKCGICEKTCPMGLLPSIGEGASAYCWNCGECVDSCCYDALHFSWREK